LTVDNRDWAGTRLGKLKPKSSERKLSRVVDYYVFHKEAIDDFLGAVAYFVFLTAVLLITAAYL